MVIWGTLPLHAEAVPAAGIFGTDTIELSPRHVEAAKRQRRIILQDDVLATGVFRTETVGPEPSSKVIDVYMSRLDEVPNQIDSIWFGWGEGHTAVWPSQVIPETKNVLPKWWEIGVDPVDVLLQESRKRDREVFFSYRINGSDNDNLHDPARPSFGPEHPIPLKTARPDWLIQGSPSAPADRKHRVAQRLHPDWNFVVPGVRDLKLRMLREVAEKYEFDGIQIDFARVAALFPEGQQWANRDKLTEFMRSVRTILLEIEKHRGRPFLLAARVPENLMRCHFDGMDVETWARENLVDILVLRCRSSDVDIAAFRRLTRSTGIMLYPCLDFHHVSDGYGHPYTTIEPIRGVDANWWMQSPDGVHTFNLMGPSSGLAQIFPGGYRPPWETRRRVFREVGSPETLQHKDKCSMCSAGEGNRGRLRRTS